MCVLVNCLEIDLHPHVCAGELFEKVTFLIIGEMINCSEIDLPVKETHIIQYPFNTRYRNQNYP